MQDDPSPEIILMSPVPLFHSILMYDSISSTNIMAKVLMIGDEEDFVVVAREQETGRGRFQRRWHSPKGGLYTSLVLHPQVSPETLTLLPLVTSLAVASVLKRFRISAKIKWPNDVHVRGKKIAGILLESSIKRKTIDYVIIGIGLNVNLTKQSLLPNVQSTSMKLQKNKTFDLNHVLFSLLEEFSTFYSLFLTQQSDVLIQEWKNRSDTMRKFISVSTLQGEIEGIAVDINTQGFLQMKTRDGSIETIDSGDCFYLMKKKKRWR